MSNRRFWAGVLAVISAGGVFVYMMPHRVPNSSGPEAVEIMYQTYRKSFPEVRDLTVSQFLKMKSERPVVLVDVRTDAERAVSIIPGAISEADFIARRDQFRNTPVVAYCTIGYRSGLFAKGASGIQVYNLAGGVLAWASAGQEFSIAGTSTRRVHVYGKKWNLLPEGYVGVW